MSAMSELDDRGEPDFDFRDVSGVLNDLGLHDNIQVKQIPMTLKCYQSELGIERVGKFPVGEGNGKRCRYRCKGL